MHLGGAIPNGSASQSDLVLVVDDDDIQVDYICVLLNRLGFRSIGCTGSEGVFERLTQCKASILVCDIEMPGLDGLELTRRIRAAGIDQYVYIVLMTARHSDGAYEEGLVAGADDFMFKPILPTLLSVRMNVAKRIVDYHGELIRQAQTLRAINDTLREDLLAAGQAQHAFLPDKPLHSAFYAVDHMFVPSQYVSGDAYNFFELPGSCIGFYAADAAGHGVRAALMAATIMHIIDRDYFYSRVSTPIPGHFAPDILATDLNKRFCSSSPDSWSYFTMICGVFDPSSNVLTYCLAGHPCPLLLNASGLALRLGQGGFPVGMLDTFDYRTERVAFLPENRLIVHSDGITDAISPSGEAFGDKRFQTLMQNYTRQDAESLSCFLNKELRRWTEKGSLDDDISLLIFNYRGL